MKKRTLTTALITVATLLTLNPASTKADIFSDGTGLTYYTDENMSLYPLTGIVTHIEYEAVPDYDLILITCANGNQFSFYAPITDCWTEEDFAACIVDNKETPIVYDDEIIVAHYAGTIKQFRAIVE